MASPDAAFHRRMKGTRQSYDLATRMKSQPSARRRTARRILFGRVIGAADPEPGLPSTSPITHPDGADPAADAGRARADPARREHDAGIGRVVGDRVRRIAVAPVAGPLRQDTGVEDLQRRLDVVRGVEHLVERLTLSGAGELGTWTFHDES